VTQVAQRPLHREGTASRGGPSFAPVRQVVDVLHALAAADIRVRYGRGRLRAFKWLLDPYFAAGVYLLLVAFVLDRPGTAVGLSVACAIVPFQLVMATIVNSLTAIQARASIITNMRFQRTLIPVASTVTETVGFASALTLIPLMMVAHGIAPTAAILWLPVLIAVNILLATAVAYPAVIAGVWFPDARPLMISLSRATFFVAPGLIALDQVRGATNDWLRANPLTGLFESYRSVFLEGQSPEAWQLLVPSGAAVLLLLVVVPLFRREQNHLPKLLGME
jgi:lipopolysaccharide transport system permease protein